MQGYGQFCPVAKAAEILTERWTPLVVRELLLGSRRFNDLRRGVPLMSPSLLAKRLKTLEAAGIVERRKGATPQGWEYHPTSAALELLPIVEALGAWGQRWVRSQLTREDLDPGLLMWDVRRRVDPSRFPQRRVAVLFEFSDAPQSKKEWWLVSEPHSVDLCLTDPGFQVELSVLTDVRSMTAVWMGDLSLDHAERAGRIQLLGTRELTRSFASWLRLSLFAGVEGRNPVRSVPPARLQARRNDARSPAPRV